jgi:hypothetical protein
MSENRTFCTICQGITLSALTLNTGYLHHASYQALESCSQQCSLCGILICALKQREDFNEALQRKELEQQIYVGACDGGYVGLGVDTNLTHFDLLVGRLQCARLQLYAAAGTHTLPGALPFITNSNKMILLHYRALSRAGRSVAGPIRMPTSS